MGSGLGEGVSLGGFLSLCGASGVGEWVLAQAGGI